MDAIPRLDVTAQNLRVLPSGAVVVLNPRTHRPVCVIEGDAVVIRSGHGRDAIDCRLSLSALRALTSGQAP